MSVEAVPVPEALDVADMPLGWGDGPAPTELRRFNLGAFCLGPLWAMFHGLWWWVIAFLAIPFASRWALPSVPVPLYVGMLVANSGLRLWFGRVAGAHTWGAARRRSRRAAGRGAMSVQQDVGMFVRSQESWAWLGLVVSCLGLGGTVFALVRRPSLVLVGSLAVGTLALAVAVLWWWLDRRRATPSA